MSHHNNRIHSLITFIIIACTCSTHGAQRGAGILPLVYHPETKVGYLVMGYGIGGFSDFGGLKDTKDFDLIETAMREFGEETGYKNLFTREDIQKAASNTVQTKNLKNELTTYTMYFVQIDYNALIGQQFIKSKEIFGIGLIPALQFFDAAKKNCLEKKTIIIRTNKSSFDEQRFFFQGYRIRKVFLACFENHAQKYKGLTPIVMHEIIILNNLSTGLAEALENEKCIQGVSIAEQTNKETGLLHSDLPHDKTLEKSDYRWLTFIKRNKYFIALTVAALGLALIIFSR